MAGDPGGGKGSPRKSSPAAAEERAPAIDPKLRLARIAAGAVLLAVAAAEFVSVVLTRDLIVASVWVIFGFVSLGTGFYLYRGRFTAWGTAIIANALAFLVALATADVYVLGALIASFIVLYVFRLPFGVGAWKIESAKENERTRALIAERTRNPDGARCPKCGGAALWVADDGSAFCLTCRTGTIELGRREPS
jgi:uncharacterized membrane protein YqjE